MRILIVEDDHKLLQQLSDQMKKENYTVETANNGADGLHKISEYSIDLAIIDLGLPDLSGIELIQQARAKKVDAAILILTARSRWQEKVEGLEAGADDYVAKPFEFEELLARVRALLRRTGRWTTSIMKCGPIELDTAQRTVTCQQELVELTSHEFKVLEYLMTHAGDVISKTQLTEHIYEEDSDRDSNVIEVFIRRLRKKLDPHKGLNPIETIRGGGYRLCLPREH